MQHWFKIKTKNKKPDTIQVAGMGGLRTETNKTTMIYGILQIHSLEQIFITEIWKLKY